MSFTGDTILVALELSNSLRLVGTRMAGAWRSQMHRVSAGDTATLMRLLDGLQARRLEHAVAHCGLLRGGTWCISGCIVC
jgi:hypothetical protein